MDEKLFGVESMSAPRVIPVICIEQGKMVKTVKFKNPNYIGDPINAIRIFNDKEVDELAILDIRASKLNQEPNYTLIQEMASECFMPISYGGGIQTVEQAGKLFELGIEKVILGSALLNDQTVLREFSDTFGSQSIVACIEYKKNWLGKIKVTGVSGNKSINDEMEDYATSLQENGCGEILLNNVDMDGTFNGVDITLTKNIINRVSVPVISCGGLASVDEIYHAQQVGITAIAGGSFFVYKNNNPQSILISYPAKKLSSIAAN